MERVTNDPPTPCLVIDIDIAKKNIDKMQSLASINGKKLRPHAKTHKCSNLAKLQIQSGGIGCCVAKLSEAQCLISNGMTGILITGPIVGERKMTQLIDLASRDPSLIAVIDNLDSARQLNVIANRYSQDVNVLIDVDVGLGRTGINAKNLRIFASSVQQMRKLRLRGVQAYAGHIQHIKSYQERRESSLAALNQIVEEFSWLARECEGFEIFSASGTGTAAIDVEVPEVTEVQVGSYVMMDAEYLSIEAYGGAEKKWMFSPSLTLRTTVVSTNQERCVTVDAGLKSVYRDGGTPLIVNKEYSGLEYDWFGDEYGKIVSATGGSLPPLGTVLDLIVPHCDPTVALFDDLYVRQDNIIVDRWKIDLRGLSQ